VNIRIWDPEEKYKDGFLKEYKHWILEISFRQHTLGCFIIFSKKEVERISELTVEEFSEIRKVMHDMERALSSTKVFSPDRFNYLQLGNTLHHLHFHGIPRYETNRNFFGITWKDQTWGHPPEWSKKDVSRDLIIAIKSELAKYI